MSTTPNKIINELSESRKLMRGVFSSNDKKTIMSSKNDNKGSILSKNRIDKVLSGHNSGIKPGNKKVISETYKAALSNSSNNYVLNHYLQS